MEGFSLEEELGEKSSLFEGFIALVSVVGPAASVSPCLFACLRECRCLLERGIQGVRWQQCDSRHGSLPAGTGPAPVRVQLPCRPPADTGWHSRPPAARRGGLGSNRDPKWRLQGLPTCCALVETHWELRQWEEGVSPSWPCHSEAL